MASERALPTRARRTSTEVLENRTIRSHEKKLVVSGDVEDPVHVIVKLKGREDAIFAKRRPKTHDLQLTPTMLTKNSCSTADDKTKPVRARKSSGQRKREDCVPKDQRRASVERSYVTGSDRTDEEVKGHVSRNSDTDDGVKCRVAGHKEEELVSAWKKWCAQRTDKLIASWLEDRASSKYTDMLDAV